jgi:zinc protease
LGGTFAIETSVKPDKAWETVDTVRKIMADLKNGKQKINQAEVFKEINRFNVLLPESYRNQDRLIWDTIVNIEIRKRNRNYFNQYIQLYNNVTAESVNQAFAQYFYPERLFTVIVGKKEVLLPQFKAANIAVEVVENH